MKELILAIVIGMAICSAALLLPLLVALLLPVATLAAIVFAIWVIIRILNYDDKGHGQNDR